MNTFTVVYWFDAGGKEVNGELVVQLLEADSLNAASAQVAANLKQPVVEFDVADSYRVLVNSASVRYCQILPEGTEKPKGGFFRGE